MRFLALCFAFLFISLSAPAKAQSLITPQLFDVACGTIGHDCTSGIQSCVNTKSCYIPVGEYNINGTITISSDFSTIIGAGQATIIHETVAGANAIYMNAAGVVLDNFSIYYDVQGTGPGGLNPSTGGIAVKLNSPSSGLNSTISRLYIFKAYIGFLSVSGQGVILKDNNIRSSTYAGIMQTDFGTTFTLKNNVVNGGCAQAGIYFYGRQGGTLIEGGNVINCTGYGFLAIPNSSNQGSVGLLITGASFDANAQGNAIMFAYGITISNSWFSFENNSGVNLSDGLLIAQSAFISINGGYFTGNGGSGINFITGISTPFFTGVSGPSNSITVTGCLCYSNKNTGILIGANTTDFTLSHNIVNYNSYGIFVNSGSDRFNVVGNQLTPNAQRCGGIISGCLISAPNVYVWANY